MSRDFFNWYLAPWRKIARGPFNTALAIVTLPGLLLMLIGLGDNIGGVAGLFTGLADAGQQARNLPPESIDMVSMARGLGQQAAAAGGGGFDLSALSAWVNGLLWLGCVPLVRMRLRDMGHANDTLMHWLGVVVAFAGTVIDLMVHAGLAMLAMADTWGAAMGFIAVLWLCLKPAPAPGRDEHFIYVPPAGGDKRP